MTLNHSVFLSVSFCDAIFFIFRASRIHNVLQTNNKLTPLEICRELGEPVTRRHMGRIFAGLLGKTVRMLS